MSISARSIARPDGGTLTASVADPATARAASSAPVLDPPSSNGLWEFRFRLFRADQERPETANH
jgi:hypothetical protein